MKFLFFFNLFNIVYWYMDDEQKQVRILKRWKRNPDRKNSVFSSVYVQEKTRTSKSERNIVDEDSLFGEVLNHRLCYS